MDTYSDLCSWANLVYKRLKQNLFIRTQLIKQKQDPQRSLLLDSLYVETLSLTRLHNSFVTKNCI